MRNFFSLICGSKCLSRSDWYISGLTLRRRYLFQWDCSALLSWRTDHHKYSQTSWLPILFRRWSLSFGSAPAVSSLTWVWRGQSEVFCEADNCPLGGPPSPHSHRRRTDMTWTSQSDTANSNLSYLQWFLVNFNEGSITRSPEKGAILYFFEFLIPKL